MQKLSSNAVYYVVLVDPMKIKIKTKTKQKNLKKQNKTKTKQNKTKKQPEVIRHNAIRIHFECRRSGDKTLVSQKS